MIKTKESESFETLFPLTFKRKERVDLKREGVFLEKDKKVGKGIEKKVGGGG